MGYLFSLINALQTSAVGLWKLSEGEARWSDSRGNRQRLSLLNGYFLADLFLAETWSGDIIFHHSVGIITTTLMLAGDFGSTFWPDAQLMEISTIFLDIGQFLRAMGRQVSRVGKLVMT